MRCHKQMPRQNNPLLIPSLFERTHNLRIFIEELKEKGENIYVSKVDSKVYFKKEFSRMCCIIWHVLRFSL